ncbi:carotenoid 9,10(9',10')-cleavage dioxygenase 1-like [Impatiens glandulifera]|uniref:carotenoid 9,10(9',10')-cleavage dioxygenase 1-like n=1 Tax=Impatiens glandulifera TaxID=253017 RepID=UPI001FB0D604|nr:carotenoid 9,10(9',10')-cleavage dioxygenase 1-like [Impatiens glandulifera]
MASSSFACQIKLSSSLHDQSQRSDHHHRSPLLSSTKPLMKEFEQAPLKLINIINFPGIIFKKISSRMLDSLVDSLFQFVDQPLLPSQKNFAPVEELGGPIEVSCDEGGIPIDFPEGVYIRNGSNPLFGGLKSTESFLGRSSCIWVEGEGMLHAVYFHKDPNGDWTVSYKNKYVESETFKLETERNRPGFLPAIEGDSPSVMAAHFLNLLRFGMINKLLSNTNIFEHSGKLYAISENHLPQEIDVLTLQTRDEWDVNGAWKRPFTSHPKKAPGSGELVIMGVEAIKPFFEVGVISADGERMVHKVDLKLSRSPLIHEMGITQKYNVIMDFPLLLSIKRLMKGGPLIKYDSEGYARIGVMPRYGDADSVKWFDVKTQCTLHIINCFEDGNEVVVRGCRAEASVLPGPERGERKHEWFSRGYKHVGMKEEVFPNDDYSHMDGKFFTRAYEWRLNMETGGVEERYLSGTDFSIDFPMVNPSFTGLKHKYAYAQVIDSLASSISGNMKYGGIAKLHFEEEASYKSNSHHNENNNGLTKMEIHKFGEGIFCSGSAFVSKEEGGNNIDEDDGWIVCFVHNELTNLSKVHIIDAKNMVSEPVAKITLPQRVPYGFHGAFFSIPN